MTISRQLSRIQLMLIIAVLIATGLSVLLQGNVFMLTRLSINDNYIVPAEVTDNIVVIAIDDASLNIYGATPAEWSRDVFADVVERLVLKNPRVVAFDLLFSEEEAEDDAFAQALLNLRQNQNRTRVVIADAGVNITTNRNQADNATSAIYFYNDLPLSQTIREAVNYQGYVNTIPDIDGVIRRSPSVVRVNNQQGLSFSMATYLAFLRIPAQAAFQVISQESNQLSLAERQVFVDDNGLWRPYFFGEPATEAMTTFPTVSVLDVLDGAVPPNFFNDKIVLIGLQNTTANLDTYAVPSSTSGTLMAGVEIQAHSIETLLQTQNRAIHELDLSTQVVIIFALAITSSLIYALPRWYFKIGLALLLVMTWFFFASTIFSTTHTEINLLDTNLAIILPLFFSIGVDITQETRLRQRKEFLLDSINRLAEQKLQMKQAVSYVISDLQRLVPNEAVAVYIRHHTLPKTYTYFEPNLDPILLHLDTNDAEYIASQTKKTLIPMYWQNDVQGILAIDHKGKANLTNPTREQLREFAEQLAPNINNLRLYDGLQQQKALLDNVFSESPTGLAIVDSAGIITRHNDDLATMLTGKQKALIDEDLAKLLEKQAQDKDFLSDIKHKLSETTPFSYDELSLDNGAFQIAFAPLQNFNLWTVVMVDVSSLVELSKLKTQMLRMASHDLKNPLNRIVGFSQLIEMVGEVSDKQKKYINYIDDAANQMQNIIQDILSLERLRSGQSEFEVTDFVSLVRDVSTSHQPDAIRKEQEFAMTFPEQPHYIKADVSQLSQAVTNLVGNAIKYTPQKGHITVRLLPQDGEIRFEVEDTGYGIPTDAQEKLFSEFYRVKMTETSHISGTGLGLSLVKSVIEAHDGTIGFTSTEGEGSTFFFTMPTTEEDHANENS